MRNPRCANKPLVPELYVKDEKKRRKPGEKVRFQWLANRTGVGTFQAHEFNLLLLTFKVEESMVGFL
jgi:hypothetical protein